MMASHVGDSGISGTTLVIKLFSAEEQKQAVPAGRYRIVEFSFAINCFDDISCSYRTITILLK